MAFIANNAYTLLAVAVTALLVISPYATVASYENLDGDRQQIHPTGGQLCSKSVDEKEMAHEILWSQHKRRRETVQYQIIASEASEDMAHRMEEVRTAYYIRCDGAKHFLAYEWYIFPRQNFSIHP